MDRDKTGELPVLFLYIHHFMIDFFYLGLYNRTIPWREVAKMQTGGQYT